MLVTQAGASRAAFFVALLLCSVVPAKAAVEVTMADLRAAARSLGFLQNVPHNNGLTIGVVYGSAEAKPMAQQAAERIRTLAGPRDTSLKAEIVALSDLANYPGRLDAVFLLPGLTAGTGAIMDVARRKHLLVMSNDPACLDQRFCMLMVRDSGRAEIVLDSALAQSAGITFSSIFAMMVKRR